MTRDTDRRFSTDEIARFLTAVDGFLEQPSAMVIIGGSAIGLVFGVELTTRDVDTFESDLAGIAGALERARQATALRVPVGPAAVADIPWNYEDRLTRILPALERLHVLAPEKHDLVLSKLVRGFPNDMQHLQDLHERDPIELDTLIDRCAAEMTHVIGGTEKLHEHVGECVERLWGELAAVRARAALRGGGR